MDSFVVYDSIISGRYNDDANGILRIYSRDPRALDNGQTVFVEEREHFSLELVVERTGENCLNTQVMKYWHDI